MTAGLHVELNRDGPSATNLVVGGANKIVKFPISSFLHLEDRESGNDEALVELVINPPSINFPANKFVTDWQPIKIHLPGEATLEHLPGLPHPLPGQVTHNPGCPHKEGAPSPSPCGRQHTGSKTHGNWSSHKTQLWRSQCHQPVGRWIQQRHELPPLKPSARRSLRAMRAPWPSAWWLKPPGSGVPPQ